ncbi:MAG TPA: hydroxymethylglutaryl-CoA lyase, partial [Opitutus sp.]|nr:hydroxymethylglutaryl-CoA lyase [Opitutus sp.]
MTRPAKIKIVEVGPRDGLQNESQIVSAAVKAELVHRLADAGLRTIEVTAFVSPQRVPQMADAAEVMRMIVRRAEASYAVLVPNLRGFEAAMAAGAREIAVFGSASETFSQRNIN